MAAAEVAWLLAEIYAAAGQPAPPAAVLQALIAQGPVPSLRALKTPAFGRRRRGHLRAAFSQPDLGAVLSERLQTLTQHAITIPETPPIPHPFGEGARFAPRVARALSLEGGLLYGTARPLPGFAFCTHVVGFRDAIHRPTPQTGIIIGGGYIGAEMALAWAQDGATVFLLERGDVLLRGYGPAQVAAVHALLREAGVHVWTNTAAGGWRPHAHRVLVAGRRNGARVLLAGDLILVAVGLDYTPPRP